MNWAHALLMAELLLKAVDKVDMLRPAADMKEEANMGDQAPIDTPVDATTMAPTDATSPDTGMPVTGMGVTNTTSAVPDATTDATPLAQTSVMAATSTGSTSSGDTTQPIVAPVEAASSPEPAITTMATEVNASDDLHKSIAGLVQLAQILDGNPDVFKFLKGLMPSSTTTNAK